MGSKPGHVECHVCHRHLKGRAAGTGVAVIGGQAPVSLEKGAPSNAKTTSCLNSFLSTSRVGSGGPFPSAPSAVTWKQRDC